MFTVSHLDSRSDLNGEIQTESGARDYILGLIDLFFLRAELVPVGYGPNSYTNNLCNNKNHLHIQKNYHRSGVHQNLYTYTESHLLI